jgi:DNA-binding transcriptional MerR regulator
MTETTPTPRTHRIGQVCELLRSEFPDVSISKLRFLQDKGIVQPQRTPGGYRSYTDADVEALRLAMRMQRDEFMPLRVIRQELQRRLAEGTDSQSASANGDASAPAATHRLAVPHGFAAPAATVDLGVDEPLVSVDAAVRAAGVSHEFFEECRSADIIAGQRDDSGALRFTQDEVRLIGLASALHNLGLDVRHLRQAAMGAARQGAIVEQYGSALLRAPGVDQRDRALRTLEQLTGDLAEFMRIAFVRDVKTMTQRTAVPTHRVVAPVS